MNEPLQDFIHVVLTQRDWSWTLVGIVYLILGLSVRSWFLSPLIRKASSLEKKQNREIKKLYLEHSLIGWFFFLVPFFILTALWNSDIKIPMTVQQALAILGATLSYIFSIISHLTAFGIASISVLKQHIDSQKAL